MTPNHAMRRTATSPCCSNRRVSLSSVAELGSLGVMRALVAAFVLAVPLPAYPRDAFSEVLPEAKPMPAKELAEFLGPVPVKALTWKKYLGPDFDVYYGHANPPLSGDVSFYLGGWPDFRPEPGSTLVAGKLGTYPVQWHRATVKDGSVTQNALIPLDDYWKVDISVHAKSQKDIDQLLAIVSQLPTFTKKPKPVGTQSDLTKRSSQPLHPATSLCRS
jgi:hypothetical protein